MPGAQRPRPEKGAVFPKKLSGDARLDGAAGNTGENRRRWRVRAFLGVLLAGAVYAILAAVADVRELGGALVELRLRSVAVALALVSAAYVLRALRWRLYLHRLGVLEPVGEEALGFASGLLMGLAQGKGGQVVKAYYLHRTAGLPLSVSVPAIFAERVSDTASLGILLALGLALDPRGSVWGDLLALALLAGLLAAFASRMLARAGARLLSRLRLFRHRAEELLAGHERLRAQIHPRRLAAPAAIGLSSFLFEALALQVLVAEGLGLALPFPSAILVLALTDLAGMLSLLPGGLGAAEGSMVVLLHLEGIPLPQATAATLLFRLCTLWYSLALGAAATSALHLLHRGRPASKPPAQGSKQERGSRGP